MLSTMLRRIGALLLVPLLVASCHMPVTTPAVVTQGGAPVATAARPVVSLHGQVSFATSRSAQALFSDVLKGATVSLINTGTNQTVSSSVTDASGSFTMNFNAGFVPDTTLTYYLEAYKGLNGNLPTNNAVRVRTLVRYTTGWVSICNSNPDQVIYVNSATTALSIAAALRNNNPTAFNFASLMGTLDVPNGNLYTPVTGITQSDYTTVQNLVNQAITNNIDPVADVSLTGSAWGSVSANAAVAPAIALSSIAPTQGPVGTSVTVTGNGFSPALTSNVLKFNGAAATLTSGSTTQLSTSVPYGATSGQTTLQVGSTTILGPLFTVPPVISSMSPTSGAPGTSVTLTGSGFDTNTLTNNYVTFAGVPATVTAINGPTSLTVVVPQVAITGKIAITVAGVSAQSAGTFAVPVSITNVTPSQAAPGSAVAITGSGFSTNLTDNVVTLAGVAATVVSATPNTLVVSAPTVSSPGPAVVTVAGQSVTSATLFSNPSAGGSSLQIQSLAGDIVPVVNQPSTTWPLYQPRGACVDASGTLYVATQEYAANGSNNVYTIGRIANGVYSRFAGGNPAGYSGDGGSALQARFNSPNGLAVDSAGNLYVADTSNHAIRKISAAGTVSTVAGNGNAGYSGDNGPAVSALLNNPQAVAVDASGNLYICDSNNYRIRKVNTSGVISTVAGTGTSGYTGDGAAATSAQISYSAGITLDSLGNLYFSDTNNSRIRKVDTSGVITTLVNNLTSVAGLSVDSSNNLYAVDTYFWSCRLRKVTTVGTPSVTVLSGTGSAGFAGDGGAATSGQLNYPQGVAVDGSGNVYVADTNNNRVRQINTSGIISSLTSGAGMYRGDNAQAIYAGLYLAAGVAVDSSGNTYIADTNNHVVRKVTPSGTITTVAGTGTAGFSGDGGAATSAQLNAPQGVAVDGSGNFYVADTNNNRVRKVTSAGTITTLAGNGTYGFAGDGGLATAGQLAQPIGVTVDPNTGNVYIADTNNHRIRQVQVSNGQIFSVVGSSAGFSGDGSLATSAQLYYPHGVAFQAPNVLYIADSSNYRIRRAVVGGNVTTVAGNGSSGNPSVDFTAATKGTINYPWGVALDASGNLYITEQGNNRIRKVDLNGVITTFAGNGNPEFTGDGGNPINAGLNSPRGIAVDPNGGIRVADTNNSLVRWIH